ncbi:hypothetical protein [Roseibacillus ishigakijimensis]|nr:hypothetical protein [Roseibacillus ishigakijimensis]
MPIPVHCAVEDKLSEAILLRCFSECGLTHATTLSRGGFGYLKKIAPALNLSAQGMPYVMLTDLDDGPCAPELIANWMNGQMRHPHFLLRVAVREVEAWLLADTANFSQFLGISANLLPEDCEMLPDPKLELLKAARRSRHRKIREDLVTQEAHGPVQGPDYNGALAKFVAENWDLSEAAGRCPSLQKLMIRLRELEQTLR